MLHELFTYECVSENVQDYVRHMRKAKSLKTLFLMVEGMERKEQNYSERSAINHAVCVRELEIEKEGS